MMMPVSRLIDYHAFLHYYLEYLLMFCVAKISHIVLFCFVTLEF